MIQKLNLETEFTREEKSIVFNSLKYIEDIIFKKMASGMTSTLLENQLITVIGNEEVKVLKFSVQAIDFEDLDEFRKRYKITAL